MAELRDKSSRLGLLLFNSFANLVRAFSTSLTTILLPLILVFILPTDEFAAWIVVYSVASYLMYLDLGLQATIQSIVGRLHGDGDVSAAQQAALSGLHVIGVVSALGFALVLVITSLLGDLFPGIPPDILAESQGALIVLAVAQLANVTTNIVSAYYAGGQRSIEPAVVSSIARVLSLLAAISAAVFTFNLVALASAFAVPLIGGLVVLLVRFEKERRTQAPTQEGNPDERPDAHWWYLLQYSGPLILWSACMLIVSGLGVVLVARFDYGAVPAYSIAMMFVAALVGLDNAVTAPLLPELSRVGIAKGRAALAAAVQNATRLNSSLLFLAVIVLLSLGWPLLVFAPLKDHESEAFGILLVAITANAFRLTMTPMTMAFIATRTHKRVLWPPVIEAGVNLISSLVLGSFMGALGVALGSLVGAIAGVTLALTWSIRLATLQEIDGAKAFKYGLLKPILLLSIPLTAAVLAPYLSPVTPLATSLIVLSLAIPGSALLWFYVVEPFERDSLMRVLRHKGIPTRATQPKSAGIDEPNAFASVLVPDSAGTEPQ